MYPDNVLIATLAIWVLCILGYFLTLQQLRLWGLLKDPSNLPRPFLCSVIATAPAVHIGSVQSGDGMQATRRKRLGYNWRLDYGRLVLGCDGVEFIVEVVKFALWLASESLGEAYRNLAPKIEVTLSYLLILQQRSCTSIPAASLTARASSPCLQKKQTPNRMKQTSSMKQPQTFELGYCFGLGCDGFGLALGVVKIT